MIKDINGDEVKEGDIIYYAMSLGRGAMLNKFKIISYYEHTPKYFRTPVIMAKAECLDSVVGRKTNISTLHAYLFCQRAVLERSL